jgi:hypothetical protein
MACGTKLSPAQLQILLRRAGFQDILVDSKTGKVPLIALMQAIGTAESSGCTDAIGTIARGREYSVGVWQINTKVHKRYSVEQLKNPDTNALEALRINKSEGLRAWGAYQDNRYKKYLPEALATYGAPATGEQPQGTTNDTIVLIAILAALAIL